MQQCSEEEEEEDEQTQVQEVEEEVSFSAQEARQMMAAVHQDLTVSCIALSVFINTQ